jgi:hypothetical protein
MCVCDCNPSIFIWNQENILIKYKYILKYEQIYKIQVR